MTILFVSNDPLIFREDSAVRARMRAYAAVLAQAGGMLHVVSRAESHVDTVEGPLHLHGMRVGRLLSPFVLSRVVRQIVEAYKVQIVSAQDPFEHGLAALRAVRGTSAKLHIQVHTDFLTPWFTRGHIYRSPRVSMPLLNGLRRHIARYVLPHAAGIRCVSERVRGSLVAAFGTRIPEPSVVPIAVDTTVPPAVTLPSHNFTFALITVGRLEPEKRVEDVLAAIARLKEGYPMLGAFIVGEGRERRKLEQVAEELGIAERVVFLGARSDARGLMQSAQAFVQASAYEGYGMTLIEAALSRVPIVTTDVGIVGEVFTGYQHALVAPVGDPTNLAAHIAWLVEDHEARKELVLSAEARAREHLAATDSSPAAVIGDITKLV